MIRLVAYSKKRMATFLNGNAGSTTATGRTFEDLICYLFQKVPGIIITKKNSFNYFRSEEIDVAFWNDKTSNGFYFLPYIILIECKNIDNSIGNADVSYFYTKIRERGLDFGILLTKEGISGSEQELSYAHHTIAMALSEGIRIIVLTKSDIENLKTTDDLISKFKMKLCELSVKGTTVDE